MSQCSHCGYVINPHQQQQQKHQCGCRSHISCLRNARTMECGSKACRKDHETKTEAPAVEASAPESSWGIFGRMKKAISPLVNYRHSVETSEDTFFLLKERTPVTKMVERGFTLRHMIAQGVHIGDILDEGYSCDGLQLFSDWNVDTLVQLKVEAEDFRDNPDKLSVTKLRQQIKGFKPEMLFTHFGLHFDKFGLMGCRDSDWKTEDLISFGLTGSDLQKHGLIHLKQWKALKPREMDARRLRIDVGNLRKPRRKKKVIQQAVPEVPTYITPMPKGEINIAVPEAIRKRMYHK